MEIKPPDKKHYIDCIGVDELIHECLPWENLTRCGVEIKYLLMEVT